MSLFSPPAGFPAHLACFWPLIWVQVLLLRAAVRAAYGRGVQYRWGVSPNGRVFLASIDWIPGQKKERTDLKTTKPCSDRLAAACDGRAAMPEYLRMLPLSLGRGVGVRGRGVSASAVCAAATSPLIPTPLLGRTQCVRLSSQAPGRRGLPLQET